jgi:hypothetical protein
MNSATLSELKRELQNLDEKTLQAICLRLAKYKKENKELLTYLLSDAHDEAGYIRQVKEEMDVMFEEVTDRNLYIVKKILRKILRMANRQIKYSGIPQTELELRIYFCEKMKQANIPLTAGTVLFNLYQQQMKKISTVLTKLDEDYHADYADAIAALNK